jgi:YXWGXW repeat-containing protein
MPSRPSRLFLLLTLLLPASVLAQVRIGIQAPSLRVEVAPPAPIEEAPPPAPSPRHVWTSGYWTFQGGRYVWVPGSYVVAPQPAARWVPARWVPGQGGWYLERGHWETVAVAPQPPPPPPPPPRPVPVRRPPPVPEVVRAGEIHAETVRAHVIYATEVHARDGRVGAVLKLHGKPPKMHDEDDIEDRDVEADTIYAREIHAEWIEADEIHAKHVRIGR